MVFDDVHGCLFCRGLPHLISNPTSSKAFPSYQW
jgi:hypothetical protein